MQIIKIESDNTELFKAFYDGMDEAFKARSNDRILYERASYEELFNELKSGAAFFAAVENSNVNAGITVASKDGKTGKIKHLWTHPTQQKKGYAKKLIEKAEEYSKQSKMQTVQLSVANIYAPAVNLYKKMGFKTIGTYANTAGTYYTLDMIKAIPPYKYSELKRIRRLVISWIKFNLLFTKDSSPRLLYKMLYGKK